MGSAIRIFDKIEQVFKPNIEMASEPRELCLDENNGFFFQETFIPEEIISIVLSYLDYRTLLQSRLVCHSWKILIDNTVLKLKAKRMHTKSLKNLSQSGINALPWYVFYTVCKIDPFNKNLLLNACGQDGFNNWHSVLNGGDGWKVESLPQGSDPLPEDALEFESDRSCFATSYSECKKQQIISLMDHGLTAKIMDEIQPDIEVSEWFAGRFDCGCYYKLNVALLNEKKDPIPGLEYQYEKTIKQWEGHAWEKIFVNFRNYGPGVRYVVFVHRGNDTQFWAGHYGTKMSCGKVLLKVPEKIPDNV